jgi:hypothetical protein
MKTGKLILGLIFWAVVLAGSAFSGIAHAQANVNESLETAFLYVDGVNGSDSNPGTQAEPFQTIGKATTVALANNQKGIGTRVTINPATYREAITVKSNSKSTSLPITLEAATKSTVEVSGSDVWTGWQPYSGNSSIYTHAWPYAWGLCPTTAGSPFEQDIVLRREMIFVNGTNLTQVLEQPEMTAGTFYVDETNGIAYIYPPAGTKVGSATIEVATRNNLLAATNVSNFVVRGIRFEHGNDCRNNDTVTFTGGSNILVDSDGFNWNNSGGFGVNAATMFTVRNSTAVHNGQRGFKSFEAKDGAWSNDEGDYSNWRGSQGGIYAWSAAGFYFYAQHNNTVSNLNTFFNMTHGIHWDTDNANVSAKGIVSAYNMRDGLMVEKSEGPVSIAGSSVCYNAPIQPYFDGGLVLRVSTYVTLTNNNLAQNAIGELEVIGIQGGVPVAVTNYETGEQYNLLNANHTYHSNVIEGGANEQLFYDFDQSGQAWTDFQTTFSSDRNTWWNPSVTDPFTVPVPNYFTAIDWSDWLSVSGQDVHSTFAAPATDPTIPCQVTADAQDFWFINYQLGEVTVDAGVPAVFTMLLIPIDGFDGKTTFTAYDVSAIPGATGSWSQTSLTGSGTVTFTVNTPKSTPAGNYPVTLIAHSGNMTRTATLALNIAN